MTERERDPITVDLPPVETSAESTEAPELTHLRWLERMLYPVLRVVAVGSPLAALYFTYVMFLRPHMKELAAMGIVVLTFAVLGVVRAALSHTKRNPKYQFRMVLIAAMFAAAACVGIFALAKALYPPKLYAARITRVPGVMPMILHISGEAPEGAWMRLHLGADCKIPFKREPVQHRKYAFWYEDRFVHPEMALSIDLVRSENGQDGMGCMNLLNLPETGSLFARR